MWIEQAGRLAVAGELAANLASQEHSVSYLQ